MTVIFWAGQMISSRIEENALMFFDPATAGSTTLAQVVGVGCPQPWARVSARPLKRFVAEACFHHDH
jgi:hypothetical protein